MITVNGIDLSFDITSPSDILKYSEAGKRMEAETAEINLPTMESDDPAFMEVYVEMLNTELCLFGNYIDEIFGEGIAEKLLGNNPSLIKVEEINNSLGKAIEAQGKEFGIILQKYKPNRATRRAKK